MRRQQHSARIWGVERSYRSQGVTQLALLLCSFTWPGCSTRTAQSPADTANGTNRPCNPAHCQVPATLFGSADVLIVDPNGKPSGLLYSSQWLPAPDTTISSPASAPETGTPETGTPSQDTAAPPKDDHESRTQLFAPDRTTSLDSSVDYAAIFRPAIAPFKRVTALDRILHRASYGNTPLLGVGNLQAQPVAIHRYEVSDDRPRETEAPGRDRFWASVPLDFSNSTRVAFPTVAPDTRLLHVDSFPRVDLKFFKDSADNHYAEIQGNTAGIATVRVSVLMDASQAYFAGPLPQTQLPGTPLKSVPTDVAQRAFPLLKQIGIQRNAPTHVAVAKLVQYFRSFQETHSPPQNSGDLFVDLVRSKKGICRHRAYGFTLLAQALGLHARFVRNEAHSWVEVGFPKANPSDTNRSSSGQSQGMEAPSIEWRRIDLGGALDGLRPSGLQHIPRYVPALADPFPQPQTYLADMERRQRQVRRAGANAPITHPNPTTRPNDRALPNEASSFDRTLTATTQKGTPEATTPQTTTQEHGNPWPTRGHSAYQVHLAALENAPVRGRTLCLKGHLEPKRPTRSQGNNSMVDIPVGVWLVAQPSGSSSRPRFLGVMRTQPGGHFNGEVDVPSDIATGHQTLHLQPMEDATADH